jgi:hypothetical protein
MHIYHQPLCLVKRISFDNRANIFMWVPALAGTGGLKPAPTCSWVNCPTFRGALLETDSEIQHGGYLKRGRGALDFDFFGESYDKYH